MRRLVFAFAGVVGVAVAVLACDIPECPVEPSNHTPDTIGACAAPKPGSSPEPRITSSGAELLADGTLVLTLSDMGLECGTQAADIGMPHDCALYGWVFTVEIPAALAVPGVIQMSDHPEIRGTVTVSAGSDGGRTGSFGDEPFFVGTLELVDLGESCVTGVLQGFGTGSPDPTLGGPELDGSFVAPRC